MDQVDTNSQRRKGLWAMLAIATVTSASAVTFALPAPANADPEVPTPVPATTTAPAPAGAPAPTTAAPAPGAPAPAGQPAPGDPNAGPPPPPAPVDPNAPPPPPPVDPNIARITNPVGGFSYLLPAGWAESDASHLDYGSALLSKMTGPPPAPNQPAPVANDTRIVMGRLDQKLYASAEANDGKAAVRLGSDMGEFFMPYPGTRINQESTPLTGANGITGSASFYEVKFSDPSKPNGQIWTGVVSAPNAATAGPPERWFVVWLGTGNNPVDKVGAKALAESILPFTAPSAPGAPGPGAPAPVTPPAPGAPAPAPAPGQAPASEVTPTPSPTPQPTLPA
ncbi:alanine and proline-rich secreted protein Apa [Mycobacterium sp. Aquia_216]|uniref:alanine and proline-rich secreted protein Apa n=1 Tax=Mycobacterium sp. Aquia_216 TaxID=2991729 RepID=UPI00227A5DC6|nr:alanine and proline-rich secreted protein Apa [Mycobacterium sp. Aquia_216]WAJ42677.1 alanine and proline-rich secreted protein Apa [Mycobacterium sp. Aquia_216]